ncbi:hypothetical protein ACHAWF_013598 [Thalassiosira exigua]
MNDDFHLEEALGGLGKNASIPYASVQSSGPPCRPLEFPAPTVENAVTVSADIVDHRTGVPFRATSVLMRRPTHDRSCPSRAPPRKNHSFDATNNRHFGTAGSADRIHSWQCAFNAPSSSLTPEAVERRKHHHQQHRRSKTALPTAQKPPPCGNHCDLPDRAYCVVRKLCNATYGSVRLCAVLKRVSRAALNHGNAANLEDGFHSLPSPHSRMRTAELDPEWETTGEMVAVKVVNWTKLQALRGRHLEDPIKELAALQQLLGRHHPNVVSILDALQSETHLFYVFPYVEGGDLCGCLLDKMNSSPTGRLDESLAMDWFCQILSGMSHLQKKGICHRDLCLENIMMDEDDTIRIIDFGLCLRVPYEDPNNRNLVTDVSANTSRRLMKDQGQCGRVQYMAPEVVMRAEAFDGFAIDLWSAGIMLFELLVGKRPFAMAHSSDKNFRIISVEGDLAGLLQAKGIELNEDAVDLLQQMLHCDPAKRLTLSEVVRHPWLQGRRESVVAPVTRDDPCNRWFVHTNSIDDMNDTKVASLLKTGIRDESFVRSSTDGSLATTAAESDVESQTQPAQRLADETGAEPEVDGLDDRAELEDGSLDDKNEQKKRNA